MHFRDICNETTDITLMLELTVYQQAAIETEQYSLRAAGAWGLATTLRNAALAVSDP